MAIGKYQYWLTEDGLTLLEGWAREGLTDEQIAKNMGIACGTLYAWKREHPQINDPLKKGKAVVDFEVENALLKRALGYTYEEVTMEQTGDKKHIRKITRHVPGDTTAQIFWLKNRKPEVWRDKRIDEVKVSQVDPETTKAIEEFLNEGTTEKTPTGN